MNYIAITMVLVCAACNTAGNLYHSEEYRKRDTLRASLMKDGSAILSEEAIQKLLASRIQLPPKLKLAICPVSQVTRQTQDSWYGAVTVPVEFLQSRQANLAALEKPLVATGRFVEITHVPRLMVPADLSLTRLREAAALMQSDLMLLYETRAELLTWHGNLFAKDVVKVHVSMDVVLLDIRTGVVPYAETFAELHEIKKTSDDWTLADLQRRAEIEGTVKVVRSAADGLVKFFIR
jgi:hypothetical protein